MNTSKSFSTVGDFNEIQIVDNVTQLEIVDLSFIPRFGVKGAGAEA